MADETTTAPPDLLATALDRFRASAAVYGEQLKREVENLRFQVPDLAWSAEANQSREAADVGGMAIPARPKIAIPKLDQPIQLILNQERAAKLGIEVHPLSPDAEDDTAEVLQGLIRRIEVDSRANVARTWAFDRAVKVGRGWYRITTEYADDEGGHPSDQRIVVKRVVNQANVFPDPYAQEPDWSDGDFLLYIEDMPLSKFKRKFPNAKVSQEGFDGWDALVTEHADWFVGTGNDRVIRVAEYCWKDYTTEKIEPKEGEEWAGREKPVWKVKWVLLSATELLCEPATLNGKYIPWVPVIGRELQPFDASKRWEGVIGPNKDAVRMHNYAASALVEQASLESKTSPIIDPEAISGYEGWWKQRNVRNFPYLPYRTGSPARPFRDPDYLQPDTSRMQANMMLVQQADSFLHSGTGAFEPTLGQDSKAKSGKQVLALQQQHDQATGNYLDSLAELSMTYEARVLLDLIPYVYDRPGRVVRILGLEDKPETVMLNQPFRRDPMTQQPQPLGPEQAPEQAIRDPKSDVFRYDLSKGRYAVTVDVNKAYDSKLQQGQQEIGELMGALPPPLMLAMLPIYLKYHDGPGMKEMGEVAKKVRDAQMPFLADEDASDPAAENAALKEQLAMAKQAATQMAQALETDMAKQEGQIKKAQIDGNNKLQLEAMRQAGENERSKEDNATKLAVKALELKVEQLMQQMAAQAGLQADAAKMDHASREAGQARDHERRMGAAQAADGQRQTREASDQERMMAAMGHRQALEQGAAASEQAMAQAEQQAELQPPAEGVSR